MTYAITGCTWQRDGGVQLDLSAGDDDCFVELAVELDDNHPYLSVWSAKVTATYPFTLPALSIADASDWVRKNQPAVDAAILDARDYAIKTGSLL